MIKPALDDPAIKDFLARKDVVAEEGARGDIRGVTVLGQAAFLPDSPERRTRVERFLGKYTPHLERLWGGRAMPADRVMFRVTPTRVRSWGLGGRGAH